MSGQHYTKPTHWMFHNGHEILSESDSRDWLVRRTDRKRVRRFMHLNDAKRYCEK